MKIVIVHNPHDHAVSEPRKQAVLQDLKAMGYSGEIHMLDFMQVRDVLPVSTTPCVFVLFDEVCGDFDPANAASIVNGVAALNLPKGV